MTNSSIKAIKIAKENAAAIEAALAAVNGCATAHTFTTFGEIEALAARAERELEYFGIAKTLRTGAAYDAVSGGAASKLYYPTRIVTLVQMLRKASGWYLVCAVAMWLCGYRGVGGLMIAAEKSGWSVCGYRGKKGLTLTKEQDERAVSVLREKYHCAE